MHFTVQKVLSQIMCADCLVEIAYVKSDAGVIIALAVWPPEVHILLP